MEIQYLRGGRCRWECIWLASALLCATGSVRGQDALRSSMAGREAAEGRGQSLENQNYNLSLGPLKVRASGSLATEYNDNVNLMQVNRSDDYLLGPQLGLNGAMPVTELNRLSFTLGIGYTFYVNNPDLNHMVVTPGSELAFDIFVGDFIINLHDRISHTQDPVAQPTISGTGQFGSTANTAGVGITGDLNQLQVGIGYDHANSWSSQSQFQNLNQSSESFYANAGLKITPLTVLGIDAGGGFSQYDEAVQNGGTHYSMGLYLNTALSEHLTVGAHAGFTGYSYGTSGRVGDPESGLNAIYFMLSVSHQLNEYFSHSLSGSQQVQPGTSSNYVEVFTLTEQIGWKMNSVISLSVPLFYVHGAESGLTAEQFDQYGIGISTGYQLMEKLSVSLGYQYVMKDSNGLLRDYYQNRVTVNLTYQF